MSRVTGAVQRPLPAASDVPVHDGARAAGSATRVALLVDGGESPGLGAH